LIESQHHTHGITVTKDGVTVAKAIDLIDPVENLAVRMMKEAAERTATSAGDGTTTAIVLTEAIVKEAMLMISENPTKKTEILRGLVSDTEDIIKSLKSHARKVTKSKLRDVATISANNDSGLGKIISDVYKEIGINGIVTIENSQTPKTYYETTSGLKIDRGYSSHLFINDHKRDECILEEVYVLVADTEINNVLQIEKILKPIISGGKRLLIVAECSKAVINTLAANVMKNSLKLCIIQPPAFGFRKHELMQDIALTVGANYFSESTGDDLSLIEFSDLGFAKKIIIGKDSTVVVKEDAEVTEEVKDRISQLQAAKEIATTKGDKDFILSRIAALSGGIGVIYVGGNTDLEQKELFDRVDDSVCAVRSALEEGILPGGGIALFKESFNVSANSTLSSRILSSALRAPLEQIWVNAGISETIEIGEDYNHGYDVKNEILGDMFELGVIDPLKVTRSALQNAVSVAVTILSTNAIITMARA
jgi:chaperonin GroEL